MPGHHSLTSETMRTFFGPADVRWWVTSGYSKLRRCSSCRAFLEPSYAALTACTYAPAAETLPGLLMTFFPRTS